MARRLPIEDEYTFYDTAEDCAAVAAPLFAENGWRWKGMGIPSEMDILRTLRWLKQTHKDGMRYYGTGRLMYHEGRFAHEKPKA